MKYSASMHPRDSDYIPSARQPHHGTVTLGTYFTITAAKRSERESLKRLIRQRLDLL